VLTEDESETEQEDDAASTGAGLDAGVPVSVFPVIVPLDEDDLKEYTFNEFFIGNFADASNKTKAVFLLAYGTCPTEFVDSCKSWQGRMLLKDYLTNVVPADIAHVLLQMIVLVKKEGDFSDQSVGAKSNGGRPQGAKNLDKNWAKFEKYFTEETLRRSFLLGEAETSDTSTPEGSVVSKQSILTWYNAAIEEINRLCTPEEAAGLSENTPGEEEDEEEGEGEDGPDADVYDTYFASLPTNIYEG
jgi:hypothetical protein